MVTIKKSANAPCDQVEPISDLPDKLEHPICAFLGINASYYIGLTGTDRNSEIGYLSAISTEMVEKALMNLLGKGTGDMTWPIVLDLYKNVVYHSYEAHERGLSATQGWSELSLKRSIL
ncbi:MAG: hypothetical protein V7724_01710 [Sediminicola sp.]